MSPSHTRTAVLVLGMHRSGTSALARVVNLLGVDLGPDLMEPKPGVNDRGFWESEQIVALHDRLYERLGTDWRDPLPLPTSWWLRPDVAELRDELVELIRLRFPTASYWGVKDPRLCRLLPLWRLALHELGVRAVCVAIVRHPLEVSESLARRDALDVSHAMQLWLRHALELEEHSRDLPRSFVGYDELLSDWRSASQRMAGELGVPWPRDLAEVAGDVEGFLSPALRHHVVRDGFAELRAFPWVETVYSALRSAAAGASGEWMQPLDEVRARMRDADALHGPVLVRLRNALRNREGDLESARAELVRREADVVLLRKELAERSQGLGRVQERLEDAMRAVEHAQLDANTAREWALTQQAEIERLRGIIELRNARIDELTREVGRRGVDLARRDRDLEHERHAVEAQRQHAERAVARAREAERQAREGAADAAQAWELARQHAHRAGVLEADVARLGGELALIRSSKTWRLTEKPRRMWHQLAFRLPARLAAWWHRTRRREGRSAGAAATRSSGENAADPSPPVSQPEEVRSRPLDFPRFDDPVVSIVIPFFNQLEYTRACLEAVLENTADVPYEVIAVDDGSTDDTGRLGEDVRGVHWMCSGRNRGFVDACNQGAEAARGGWIVFLNNDTQVRPGWLTALLDGFRHHPRVGAVGAKLLAPGGTLQEAGAIIWSDATGWQYGRGDDPEKAEYNYVREVDYCSGACLLVPRGLFHELGGFDRRFAPAYYEDVDLCFAIRAAGLRVLYQPRAEVVHAEGATAGRDPARGVKRFQELHRSVFAAKWAAALASQPAPETSLALARARDAEPRVLVIDARTPMADNDAGSLRMHRMLQILTGIGCHVTFSPEIPVHAGRYTRALEALGVEVLYARSPSTADLERHLEMFGHLYGTVILSRFYIARNWTTLVRKHCPAARLVLDTVDLHFLRERRQAIVSGRPECEPGVDHIRTEEIRAAQEVDLTVVVSEDEASVLRAEAGDIAIEILPTIHDLEREGPDFWEREGALFIGSFQHPPNVDAVEFYAREIEPIVQRELPGFVVTVIGGDVPDSLRAYASETLRFVGQVADLSPYFARARLSIAPLRFGAGVKGKINTSLSFGVPVVTTAIGAEGLHMRDGVELLFSDDAAGFATAMVRLYRDPVLWMELVRAGRAAITSRFSFGVAERALRRIVGRGDAPVTVAVSEREQRLSHEVERYRDVENVHDLPPIYHYWSRKFLLDKLRACGVRGVDEFFLDSVEAICAARAPHPARFASIGAGNAELEVRLARRLRDKGMRGFTFSCVELNPHMIERGERLARREGVEEEIHFIQADVGSWSPDDLLDAVIANHSLHHIVELESLFDQVKNAIQPAGVFLVNDMIGRNGHMRWPEALAIVNSIWKTMPDRYKYNHQLHRLEADFENWDCARDSNEGVRAQDILPLLLERFHFEMFCGFANVIDVFIDRSFGPNFDPDRPEDCRFIDEVARLDDEQIDLGLVKPTHMIAALRSRPCGRTVCYRHWTPEFSVRY